MSVESLPEVFIAHHREDTAGFSDVVEYSLVLAPYLMYLQMWLCDYVNENFTSLGCTGIWRLAYSFSITQELSYWLLEPSKMPISHNLSDPNSQSATTFWRYSHRHSGRRLLNKKAVFVYLKHDAATWLRLVLYLIILLPRITKISDRCHHLQFIVVVGFITCLSQKGLTMLAQAYMEVTM